MSINTQSPTNNEPPPHNMNIDSPAQKTSDTEESISPESKRERRLKLHKHLEWLFSKEKILSSTQVELIQHDFPVSQLETLFNQQRALLDEIFYVLREQEQVGVLPELYMQDFGNLNKFDSGSFASQWMDKEKGYLGRDSLWMKRYEELNQFRLVNGHTNVTKVHAGYDSLANWVNQQRRLWRLGQLNAQREKLLSQIGFEFDRRGVFQNPKAVGGEQPTQPTPQQKPQTIPSQQHPLQHNLSQQQQMNHIQIPNPPSIQIPLKSQATPSQPQQQQVPSIQPQAHPKPSSVPTPQLPSIQNLPKPVPQNQVPFPPIQSQQTPLQRTIPLQTAQPQTSPVTQPHPLHATPPKAQVQNVVQQQRPPSQPTLVPAAPSAAQYAIQPPRPLQTQATPSNPNPVPQQQPRVSNILSQQSQQQLPSIQFNIPPP